MQLHQHYNLNFLINLRCLFSIVLIISITSINAQVNCTGLLGTPVVNITFDSGNVNPGPELSVAVPGASTTYNFASYATGTPPVPPNDGDYALVNEVPGNGAWYSGAKDHTGNLNGYMAFFNASPAAGEFYKQNIRGLNPGTAYEFAAWIANVINPAVLNTAILPNITFQILDSASQAVLGSYNTGDIQDSTVMTWRQYSLLFTMPAGLTTITLKLINNNVGGTQQPGNDLAIDDITFRPCLATMPLVLKNFHGTIVNKSAILAWTTFDEVNTKADIIERSYDGSSFTVAGSLPAKGSMQQNNYQFTDYPSFSNTNVFYKLKLTDKDGKYTYSNVLALPTSTMISSSVKLFPNPAKNYIQLAYFSNKEEATIINITDIFGKTIITKPAKTTKGVNSVILNFENKLSSGIYIVKCLVNGQISVSKLVAE